MKKIYIILFTLGFISVGCGLCLKIMDNNSLNVDGNNENSVDKNKQEALENLKKQVAFGETEVIFKEEDDNSYTFIHRTIKEKEILATYKVDKKTGKITSDLEIEVDENKEPEMILKKFNELYNKENKDAFIKPDIDRENIYKIYLKENATTTNIYEYDVTSQEFKQVDY